MYPFVSSNRRATNWRQCCCRHKKHVDGNKWIQHVAGQHVSSRYKLGLTNVFLFVAWRLSLRAVLQMLAMMILVMTSSSNTRTNTRLTVRRKRSTRRATQPVTSYSWRMRSTAGCTSVAVPRSTTDTSDVRPTWSSWQMRAARDARRARSPSRTRCSPSRSRAPRI